MHLYKTNSLCTVLYFTQHYFIALLLSFLVTIVLDRSWRRCLFEVCNINCNTLTDQQGGNSRTTPNNTIVIIVSEIVVFCCWDKESMKQYYLRDWCALVQMLEAQAWSSKQTWEWRWRNFTHENAPKETQAHGCGPGASDTSEINLRCIFGEESKNTEEAPWHVWVNLKIILP